MPTLPDGSATTDAVAPYSESNLDTTGTALRQPRSARTAVVVVGVALAALGSLMISGSATDPATLGLTICVVSVAVGVTIARLFSRAALGPAVLIVTLSHLLLYLARPGYAVLFQDSRNIFTDEPYDHYFVVAEIVAGIGFVAMCAGIGIAHRCVRAPLTARSPRAVSANTWKSVRRPLLAVFGVGVLLYLLYIVSVGPAEWFDGTFSGRSTTYYDAVDSTSGYFLQGITIATGVALFMLFQAISSHNRPASACWGGVVVLLLVPQAAAGDRSTFIPVLVAVVLLVRLRNPRALSPVHLIVFSPILFILLVVAPRIWRDGLSRGQTIGDALSAAVQPDQAFGQFLGGLDTAMVDALQLQVRAQETGFLTAAHGRTYVSALLSWVPRSIWENKPLSVDQTLNLILFPETAVKRIGLAFGGYSEPYYNFGIAGVALVLLVFGLGLGALEATARARPLLLPAFAACLAAADSFVMLRGNITYNIQLLLLLALPTLLTFGLVRVHRRVVARS